MIPTNPSGERVVESFVYVCAECGRAAPLPGTERTCLERRDRHPMLRACENWRKAEVVPAASLTSARESARVLAEAVKRFSDSWWEFEGLGDPQAVYNAIAGSVNDLDAALATFDSSTQSEGEAAGEGERA